MSINTRTLFMLGGGITGAYTSDITENPLTGILSTGVGLGMGSFMNIPETSFRSMTKVNMGPEINIDYIKKRELESNIGFNNDVFKNKVDMFYNRTKQPLDERINSYKTRYNISTNIMSPETIVRQIEAKRKLEANYLKRVDKINSKYDNILLNRLNFNNDLLEIKKGNISTSEGRKEAEYYNRAILREERSIQRYLETPKGKSELKSYDFWIEQQKGLRKNLEGRDIYELRNALFNEYTRDGKNFRGLKKRQEYYNKRLHEDKKDLFNPWFRDLKKSNQESLSEFELRSSFLFNDFKTEVNSKRQALIDKQKELYNERLVNLDSWIDNSFSKSLTNSNKRINKYNKRVDKEVLNYTNEQNIYNNLKALLKNSGIKVSDNREDIINAIHSIDDENILRKIDVALNNSNVGFLNQSQLKVKKWDSVYKQTNNLDQITTWFKDKLGNNVIDAENKAKMFFNRAVGGSVILKDGSISFVDKANSERVTIPLTSYNKEGIRYHNMGKGNYSVASQFNPYSSAYVDGLEVNIDGVKRAVTAQDIVKGYDAETMIKHLPEDKPIASVLPKIKSLLHYDSQEAGVRSPDINSQMFINNQDIVDLNTVLKYNEYGEIDSDFPFRKLKQTSTKDLASERQRVFLKLAQELNPEEASHLMDGLSLGNLTSINTKGYDSLALFAPNERGETSVGNRGTKIINKNNNTQILEDLLGSERFNKQFSSSQVLNRLDVYDDKLFNSIATALYGNDIVLGDGAGFYNMGDVDSLRISDKSIIKVPMSNNMAIANQELLLGLTSEEGLSEFLKNNPINITNDPIAFKDNGSKINLNKMYSSGTIVDGFIVDNEIRLVVDSIFDPNTEKNMKFFSVGSKSLNTGIEQNRFEILAELGTAINEGRIKQVGDKVEYNKVLYSNRLDLLGALSKNKRNGTTLISGAGDTGASEVREMLLNGRKGDHIYDLLMKKHSDQKVAAMTSVLFSETKSAVDLTTTLGIEIDKKIREGILDSSFREDFLYHFNTKNFNKTTNKEGFINKVYNLVASSGIVDTYLQGHSLTVGSFNKGASIVGKDNRAKLSWTAIRNLQASGLSKEDLNIFGIKDMEALYELKSISKERRLSNSNINSIIEGKEARFLNIITGGNKPEKRYDLLKSAFGNSVDILENNPYLTYNLAFRNHDIKSLNFSRISTNRSGLYEDFDTNLLKELEKKKLDIFTSDLDYKNALSVKERNTAEKVLTTKLNEYDALTKKMLSGDNNLLKEGLSLYSEKSSIMQVKYIGGNADSYATEELKKGRHTWFISEEDAENKAKQLGVTLEWENIEGKGNLKKPVFIRNNEKIPLASLVTREPAQGPLSSDLISYVVDTTLKENKGNIFVPINSKIYYDAMFGDGDQDTVQTLLGNFQNRTQYDALESKRRPIRQSFFDLQDVISVMKVKGGKKSAKSLYDFETETEHATYRVSGGLKGRNRKTLAAAGTGLAVSYAKALELNLNGEGVSKELTQGRIMIHQLVENLLKSAHLDTDSFQLVNEQDVERLSRMRSGFLGKKGYEGVTIDQYKTELQKTLPKFLGINNIKTDSIKDKNTKDKATNIMNLIIDSEVNKAQIVGNLSFTPLDINEKRFSKNSMEFIDSVNSVIKEAGITDIDLEDGLKHIRKSTGQVANGVYDYLIDVAKSNKGVLFGGLAAMTGIAILGREQPSFSDSRTNSRQHSANMLRSPGSLDNTSQNNTPMGIETNPTKAGYVLPKTFGAKGIKISGEMFNSTSEVYNEYNSLLDTDNIQDQFYNMANSIFGDGIRSARLQTN